MNGLFPRRDRRGYNRTSVRFPSPVRKDGGYVVPGNQNVILPDTCNCRAPEKKLLDVNGARNAGFATRQPLVWPAPPVPVPELLTNPPVKPPSGPPDGNPLI